MSRSISSSGESLVIRRVCGSSVCQQLASLSMTLRSRGASSAKNSFRGSPPGAEQIDLVDQALGRPCHASQCLTRRRKNPHARGMVVSRRGGHAARTESTDTGGTMTSASQAALASIAHGPGEGEHLWFFGGLTTIKADGAKTGGRVMVTEQLGPRASGSPLHVHHNEDEWFYVLEGELTIWVDGRTVVAAAGSFVFGPRDVPHTFVVSSEQARFLLVTEPAGFEASSARSPPRRPRRRSRPPRRRRRTSSPCSEPPRTRASRSSALPASRPDRHIDRDLGRDRT
jgi:quercetin dioxygenase-like cupin family protein